MELPETDNSQEFDVIVVGGGGSGLAAAVASAEKGATVLLLEKTPNLGGTTGIAIGSFTANGTVYQRRAGIDDNPDDHEADAALFGPTEIQAENHQELRRFFLGQAAETFDWLMGLGLQFYGPSPEPPNRVPRMHNVVPNAQGLYRHSAKSTASAGWPHRMRLPGGIVADGSRPRRWCDRLPEGTTSANSCCPRRRAGSGRLRQFAGDDRPS